MNKLLSTLKVIVIAALLSLPYLHSCYSQNSKLANTLLWKITGNGLSKPSYLFGTMHISNRIAFHLQDSFFTALENVEFVALELNPESWLTDMLESRTYNEMQSLYSNQGNNNSNLYNDLTKITVPNTLDYKKAFSDNNQIINQLLYRSNTSPLEMNYEEDTYLDLYLYQTGKKLNKKVCGLENFDQSMQMLIKSMIPDESTLKGPDNNYFNNLKKGMVTRDKLEKAYRQGNITELDSLNNLINPSANHKKYLIVERNRIMVRSMDSIMKSGALFTGVGAAHLPGDEGIIKMLRNKGYTVNPVLGSESNLGRKAREKLEKKFHQVKTSTFHFPDSTIQYALPEKFTSIPTLLGNKMFLYTDMANGSYYAAVKTPHFASLQGRNESFIHKQLDSILYETIPGKIVTKKSILSNNGNPGFDIVSRLHNGYMMQFRIYATPVEVITFKARGPATAFRSQQWSDFFATIKFPDNKPGQWTNITPPKTNISVSVPENKSVFVNDIKTGKSASVYAFDGQDSSFYTLNTYTLNDFNYLEDDTFELNYISELFAKNNNAKLVYQKPIHPEKYNGLVSMFQNNNKLIQTHVLINKNQYLVLSAYGKDTTKWNSFFTSIKFVEPATIQSYTLVDSTLQFQTLTDSQMKNEGESIISSIQRTFKSSPVYARFFDQQNGTNKNIYSSASFPSNIEVTREKLTPYFHSVSTDSFWISQKNRILNYRYLHNGNHVIRVNTKEIPDTLLSATFLLKDSFTGQSVYIKKMVKNDHLYTISTITDTLTGLNAWQKQFYTHFAPWDTCQKYSLLERKDKLYLSDITTKDSAKFASATEYMNAYDVLTDNPILSDSLLLYTQSEGFKIRKNSEKLSILGLIPMLKFTKDTHYKIVDNLYKDNADNSEIQFILLRSLVTQKTKQATNVFKQLISANAPLSEDNEIIGSIFESFADSLELAKDLFPDILKLTQYPEYKTSVIRLLASLIAEKKINTELWISEKNSLLRDAQIELKRFISENAVKANLSDEEKENDYDKQQITSSLPWLDNQGPGSLACYTVIFSSIATTDAPARQFTDKVLNTGHHGLVYSFSLVQYHQKQPVNDSIWNWLAADDNSRMHFCDWLEETKDTVLYPQKYYAQDKMSLSWVVDISATNKKDSLQFICKRKVSNVIGSGYLYFYKYKVKDQWKLNYVGFQPVDTTKMLSDFSYYDYGGIDLEDTTEKTINMQINAICNEIRLKGRQRVDTEAKENNSFNEEMF